MGWRSILLGWILSLKLATINSEVQHNNWDLREVLGTYSSSKTHHYQTGRITGCALNRPIWGGESSGPLLRHIDPSARFFVVFDAISGFHQVAVDPESSKLLNITTQMGNFRYTVLGQGLSCSQDLFNYITAGSTQMDPDFNILKNVNDFCLFSDTIEGLEIQIKKLMKMCESINLKLSASQFKLSTTGNYR